ncbi:hypothetical protein F5Y16DRAFT_417754 [Xylariaceae sp. FL0255]|nr:hypothetical protein F5Y16DRAFT_417754 [Xylariaceae sp. FL0255]
MATISNASNATEGFDHQKFAFLSSDGVHDADALKSCVSCDGHATLHCPHCQTWFCSNDCQKKDWKTHKTLCKSSKGEFHPANCPNNHVRGIIFSVKSAMPSWVWLKLNNLGPSIIQSMGHAVPKRTKNRSRSAILSDILLVNDLNRQIPQRKIGHGLRQFFAPKLRLEGSNINQSILQLAYPGRLRVYFGSAIFCGFRTAIDPNGSPRVFYEDATMRDLHMIVDWYYNRIDNPCIPDPKRFPVNFYAEPDSPAYIIPAVKINSDGDVERLSQFLPLNRRLDPIEPVKVLSKDVNYKRLDCLVASMAELPWVIHQCLGCYDDILDEKDFNKLNLNRLGQFFMPFHDDKAMADGSGNLMAVAASSAHCGSIVVSHKYGSVVNSFHVEAFKQFVTSIVHNLAHEQQTVDGARHFVSEKGMRKVVTKDNFLSFWSGFVDSWAILTGLPPATIAKVPPYNDGVEVRFQWGNYVLPLQMDSATKDEARKAREDAESDLLALRTDVEKGKMGDGDD